MRADHALLAATILSGTKFELGNDVVDAMKVVWAVRLARFITQEVNRTEPK